MCRGVSVASSIAFTRKLFLDSSHGNASWRVDKVDVMAQPFQRGPADILTFWFCTQLTAWAGEDMASVSAERSSSLSDAPRKYTVTVKTSSMKGMQHQSHGPCRTLNPAVGPEWPRLLERHASGCRVWVARRVVMAWELSCVGGGILRMHEAVQALAQMTTSFCHYLAAEPAPRTYPSRRQRRRSSRAAVTRSPLCCRSWASCSRRCWRWGRRARGPAGTWRGCTSLSKSWLPPTTALPQAAPTSSALSTSALPEPLAPGHRAITPS